MAIVISGIFSSELQMRKSSWSRQLPCGTLRVGNIGSAVSEPVITVASLFDRYDLNKFGDRHESPAPARASIIQQCLIVSNAREQSRGRTPITEWGLFFISLLHRSIACIRARRQSLRRLKPNWRSSNFLLASRKSVSFVEISLSGTSPRDGRTETGL